MILHLDTHAFVWLFEKRLKKFSKLALTKIESHALRISPAVYLETQYLYEIGRLKVTAPMIYSYLHETIELQFCGQPFPRVMRQSCEETWTRDPFDRMITSQARLGKAILLTADEKITENYERVLI